MTTNTYLETINKRYKAGNATEHTFRGDLQQLLESLVPTIIATNEPKRIRCGAPDYIITSKKNIPIGYIEAKDIGISLEKTDKTDQLTRYKGSLDNLILTDYCDFWFYKNGVFTTKIQIAKIEGKEIKPLPENIATFENLIQSFCTQVTQSIKSAPKLAEMMANKARMIQQVIELALKSDEENYENTSLQDQYEAFKEILIHDLTQEQFADVYAQTIAYGMFAARFHDPTLETFSRQEASELLPKSNPFLRKLFQHIAGYDVDERITWILDDLVDIFKASDVKAILQTWGSNTGQQDAIVHFYETFLSLYNPALRKSRGVWYTPEAVVNFMVRAVDDILKDEFGLANGLADTSKTKITVRNEQAKKKQEEIEVHKVQILDPATGTGTFLAEIIKYLYNSRFKAMQGVWGSYVENDLLPRLNGFEIMMASYAMAHLKLDMLLSETGYKPTKASNQRFKVYLTNSLEEYHPDTGTLFSSWLSQEAEEANKLKKDTPVMVVIGNPPYSGESANKGDWIMNLMEDYKKEPEGKEKLKEKNPKWINDDYVKFIRFGQHFIEKNGTGVLAYINPHGFLDNPTFRGMRWNLLKTFDKIYTIDLHGNSKKKEVAPDGGKDENVFDIQQGVSINFFIKTGKKKPNELGQVYHFDLYGEREFKYDFLWKNKFEEIRYKVLPNKAPMYFMVQKDFGLENTYDLGFAIDKLFQINNVGIVTSKDDVLISDKKNDLIAKVTEYYKIEANTEKIKEISYRPFDNKKVYYDTKILERAREKVMQHLIKGENWGLVVGRQSTNDYWCNIQITNTIIDNRFHFSYKGISSIFPLYLYLDSSDLFSTPQREPNLNMEIVAKIAEGLGLQFTAEPKEGVSQKEETKDTFAPIDILDYIYAVLHSPTYRERYKEFLKIDFPRVPYPKDADTFWQLVALGGELRKFHLLEHQDTEKFITGYPEGGSNKVEKPAYKEGKVYINKEQYFEGVPEVAWEFFIGGYQPTQKWLKDRKDRELTYEDILHYQKIIVALTQTDRLMKEIDKIEV